MKNTFFTLFESILKVLNSATTVIISLALVLFMWGIIRILFNSSNEIAKKEGRSYMMYGVLTLFVMTSLWGLVNILNGTVLPKVVTPQQNTTNQDGFTGDVNSDSESIQSPETQYPSVIDSQDAFENNNEQGEV